MALENVTSGTKVERHRLENTDLASNNRVTGSELGTYKFHRSTKHKIPQVGNKL